MWIGNFPIGHNSMTIDRSTLGFGARKRAQVDISNANLLISMRPISEDCSNTIFDPSPDSYRVSRIMEEALQLISGGMNWSQWHLRGDFL